jgi:non-heme chloroperoxidase
VKLLKKGTLKVHENFPRGMSTTHAGVVNPDLLAFMKTTATPARNQPT